MATLKEIALRTGLSLSTVSIVLRGQARERHIAPQTEALILETARSMGYRPNLSARQLRGQEKRLLVALYLADDFRTPMMLRFLTGLRQQMAQRPDLELIVRLYHPGKLAPALDADMQSRFHAAMICNMADEDLWALEKNPPRIPLVLYNRSSRAFPAVELDNETIGALPARIFADQGCRRAVFLAPATQFAHQRIRLAAFHQTAERLGLTVEQHIQPNTIAGGEAAGSALLSQPPDCIFATGDKLALGVQKALRPLPAAAQPKLIAIANGDPELPEYAGLSAIELPMEDMARRCFTLLLAQLNGQPAPSAILPVRYVPRHTCP